MGICYRSLAANIAGLFGFGRRLGATAEIFCQEFLRCRHKDEAVFRAGEAMSFIGEEEVFDRLTVLAHRLNDLVAFGLLDTGIVGSLRDEEGFGDPVGAEEGRT